MTTIVGTLGALILGGAIGTFTLVGVVHNQTSPSDSSSSSSSSSEDQIAYGE